MGTANAWSTYFEGDPSTPRAQYTLSAHGTHYVLLTNRHTGGLLDTDHTSAGAYVYSDKRGTGANNLWPRPVA